MLFDGRFFRLAVGVVATLPVTNDLFGQTFHWDRTNQMVTSTSQINGTLQGNIDVGSGPIRVAENDLDAASTDSDNPIAVIPGGSGGGGGDGASPIGGGLGGAAGAPGGGQNGQNGLNEFVAPGRTIFGGGGGAAGGDGSAEVDAITAGISSRRSCCA